MLRAPLIALCVIGALPFGCKPAAVRLRHDSPLGVTAKSPPPSAKKPTTDSTPPTAPAEPAAPPASPPVDTIEEWLWKHPEVINLAVTHDYHYDADMKFIAGAVQIEEETTICIAQQPITGMNEKTAPPAVRCFLEPDAVLADDTTDKTSDRCNPLRFDINQDIAWLNVRLVTAKGLVVKVYPCIAGPVYQTTDAIYEKNETSSSHPFDFPPWPASAEADNLKRQQRAASPPSRHPEALIPSPSTQETTADWNVVLGVRSDVRTRQLWHDGERRLLELVCEDDDAHTLLFRTLLPTAAGTSPVLRWIASAGWAFRRVLRARPTPELLEDSVSLLIEDYDTGSSLETAYPNPLHFAVLRIMSADQYDSWRERVGDETLEDEAWPTNDEYDAPPYGLLREVAAIHVGEIGFVRITGTESHTWRVFHGVRVMSKGCIRVKKQLAFTAPFNRETSRFGRPRPLSIKPGNEQGDPGARYVGRPGRYRLEGNAFVKGSCKRPRDKK